MSCNVGLGYCISLNLLHEHGTGKDDRKCVTTEYSGSVMELMNILWEYCGLERALMMPAIHTSHADGL